MILIWAPYEQGINVGSGDSFCLKILKCRLVNRDGQNLNKAKWMKKKAKCTSKNHGKGTNFSTREESGLIVA